MATERSTKNRTWAIVAAIVTIVGLIVGVFVYGTYYENVVKPQEEKARIAAADVSACEVFQTYLQKSSSEADLSAAFNDIFRGANKALEQYDPEGTSTKESFGDEYDQFLNLAKVEFAIDQLGSEATGVVAEQINYIQVTCANVLKVNSTPSASPTN